MSPSLFTHPHTPLWQLCIFAKRIGSPCHYFEDMPLLSTLCIWEKMLLLIAKRVSTAIFKADIVSMGNLLIKYFIVHSCVFHNKVALWSPAFCCRHVSGSLNLPPLHSWPCAAFPGQRLDECFFSPSPNIPRHVHCTSALSLNPPPVALGPTIWCS